MRSALSVAVVPDRRVSRAAHRAAKSGAQRGGAACLHGRSHHRTVRDQQERSNVPARHRARRALPHPRWPLHLSRGGRHLCAEEPSLALLSSDLSSLALSCQGATPVHYRHALLGDPLHPFEHEALRIGGEWQWSCDRREWFPTSSTHISRGIFAVADWTLVEANCELVTFLDRWPLVPLVRRELGLNSPQEGEHTVDEEFWRTMHSDVARANAAQLDELFFDSVNSAEVQRCRRVRTGAPLTSASVCELLVTAAAILHL
eukprot:5690267-Prymnesium_polylepis.1